MAQTDINSAGAVVVRKNGDVLLVHRPKYDDWSFAKGKLDPDEHITGCAVREVREETGLDVRLGRPLPAQHYPIGSRTKVVYYWVGHPVGDDNVSSYQANSEIDQVRWVPADKAARLLTYQYDRDTLASAVTEKSRTKTLIILRHADTRSRGQWPADDTLRPLDASGEGQAVEIIGLLSPYGVTRLVSSTSYRCVQTLVPFADATASHIETEPVLSEELTTTEGVRGLVDAIRSSGTQTVLCSHRPVLPKVFAALGVKDPGLAPGQLCVVHHRKGQVIATEIHTAPAAAAFTGYPVKASLPG